MLLGILSERSEKEQRVALIPAVIPNLSKIGIDVLFQAGAGEGAGFPDNAYSEKGATLTSSPAEVFEKADIIAGFQVKQSLAGSLRSGQVLVGLLNPLANHEIINVLAEKRASAFALELLPRITRAQGMDALTSMATVAGYKAVLMAAVNLNKMFPLLMTAAGTITPARVFIVGAGVAGLQAIATARRLGAVVTAYDVRPAVKEQVESLGAKFLEIEMPTKEAEGEGGYARAMDEEFYDRQRKAMSQAVQESDVVITTAAIPGKKAPVLITNEMIEGMKPGTVIVDLAAETGGNCEGTVPGETKQVNGVSIMGPINLAATLPQDASQMYARNITAFLQNLVKDGKLQLNQEDEIIRETLVTHEGNIVNSRVKEAMKNQE